jgi:hypothetical protein
MPVSTESTPALTNKVPEEDGFPGQERVWIEMRQSIKRIVTRGKGSVIISLVFCALTLSRFGLPALQNDANDSTTTEQLLNWPHFRGPAPSVAQFMRIHHSTVLESLHPSISSESKQKYSQKFPPVFISVFRSVHPPKQLPNKSKEIRGSAVKLRQGLRASRKSGMPSDFHPSPALCVRI